MAGYARRMVQPIALGFHTGHWEVGLLVAEAARELKTLRCGAVCRGVHRSLRWANAGHDGDDGLAAVSQRCGDGAAAADAVAADAAGVLGVATCDKGLPAMMMALASAGECRRCWCRAA